VILRTLVVGLVLFTAALVQTSILPLITLSGFRPDLLLLVTIAFALQDGLLTGLRVGFAAGVLTDLLLNGSPVGLTALVFIGVAYAVGLARPYLAPESVTAPMIMAAMGTMLGVAGYGLFAAVLAEEPTSIDLVMQASIVSGVYAVLLAPAVMALVRRLSRQFPTEQSRLA
jgi:rod shape-determining protein MreD